MSGRETQCQPAKFAIEQNPHFFYDSETNCPLFDKHLLSAVLRIHKADLRITRTSGSLLQLSRCHSLFSSGIYVVKLSRKLSSIIPSGM